MNKRTVGLFLLLALAACPRRLPTMLSPGSQESAEVWLQRADAAERKVGSLKVSGKLTITSAEGSGTVNVDVEAARPARVRVDSYDFFNRPVAQLVSDGTRFGLYQATGNRYYDGPATPANLMRFTAVPLEPTELLRLLLGGAPRLDGAESTLATDPKANLYVVTQRLGDETETLRIEPLTARVVEARRDGPRGFHARFDDFESMGSFTFPRRIRLESTTHGTTLDLRYQSPTVNTPPAADSFIPVAPDGVPTTHLP